MPEYVSFPDIVILNPYLIRQTKNLKILNQWFMNKRNFT